MSVKVIGVCTICQYPVKADDDIIVIAKGKFKRRDYRDYYGDHQTDTEAAFTSAKKRVVCSKCQDEFEMALERIGLGA